MKRRKMLKKVPRFKTPEEEIEFWDTHDSTEYIDWGKAVSLKIGANVKSPRDLSPRCPNHRNQVLYTRWRNVVVADGFATVNKVPELYCPRGDYTRLAPKTRKLVHEAEVALKRVQHKVEKIAA